MSLTPEQKRRNRAFLPDDPAAGVPQGLRLVPVEPTPLMLACGGSAANQSLADVWRSMLDAAEMDAAPQPAGVPKEVRGKVYDVLLQHGVAADYIRAVSKILAAPPPYDFAKARSEHYANLPDYDDGPSGAEPPKEKGP